MNFIEGIVYVHKCVVDFKHQVIDTEKRKKQTKSTTQTKIFGSEFCD